MNANREERITRICQLAKLLVPYLSTYSRNKTPRQLKTLRNASIKKKKKEETWGSSTVKLVNYSSLFVTKGNLTVDCVFTGKHEVYRTKHTRHGQEWIYLMMSYYMLVVGHLQRVYTAVAFSLALVLVGGGGGCRERDSSTKQTNDQMSPSVRHVFLLVSKNIRLCPVYTSARCATILPGCGMYGSPPAHKSRICCCRFWTIEPIRNELCKSLFSRPPPLCPVSNMEPSGSWPPSFLFHATKTIRRASLLSFPFL